MFDLNLLFYIFSIFLVISSFIIVIAWHPFFSLLALIISFILAAFLLLLLECELLALLFIIIYVSAIAILFLFSVMMLESKLKNYYKNSFKYLPIGLIFGIIFLTFIFCRISFSFENNYNFNYFYLNLYQNWYDLMDSAYDMETYGQMLYSYYVFQFLVLGLILLLILIGVVILTNNFIDETLNNALFKQLSRNSKLLFQK